MKIMRTSSSCVSALMCFRLLLLTSNVLAQQQDTSSCIQISGGNSQPLTLQPVPGSGDNPLSGSYTANTPFSTADYTVTQFELSAECTSNGPQAAPSCDWEVDLSFCDVGTTCDSSNKSYRTGSFKAFGTGPVAYFIEGLGTGSFEGVSGSIDSELNLQNFNLENVQVQLCSKNVNYGDKIFLQVNSVDSRWLSGGRTGGNEKVVTRDALSTYEQTVAASTYKWTVRSNAGNGNLDNIDPKNSRCVKYGDVVHLQVNTMNNRWLTGGRGGGNNGVSTKDKLSSRYEQITVSFTYEWIVRSAPGQGEKSFKDPRFGRCLEYGDIINLQVNLDNRWLSGGRSGDNSGVATKDKYSSDNNNYERRVAESTYSWIVRSELGDGSRP